MLERINSIKRCKCLLGGNWLIAPTLKNINLKVEKCKFIGTAGNVGSRKSGLIGVLLDEAPFY